mgnify:CR=1 FL=1
MEDFVPYELAKKLEEKGFNEPCIAHYSGGALYYNSFGVHGEDEYIDYNISIDVRDLLRRKGLLAPTISQVLKWLREEKGFHIDIRFDNRGFGACVDKYDIHTLEYISFNPLLDFGFHKSYEQAAIEGIEYALNKLS